MTNVELYNVHFNYMSKV